MHRDEFRRIVNDSVRESLTDQGFDYHNLPPDQLSQLTSAIADGVFAGLEQLVDNPTLAANATLASAAAAATAAATAAASIAQDTRAAVAGIPAASRGTIEVAGMDAPVVPAGPPPPAAVKPGVYSGRVPDAGITAEALIWRGRPYLTLGTIYELTSQRLRIIRGIASNAIDEIELVRVRDSNVTQSVAERMFHIGDIKVISDDASTPTLVLANVMNPVDVREAIRKAVYEERERRKLLYREELDGGDLGGPDFS